MFSVKPRRQREAHEEWEWQSDIPRRPSLLVRHTTPVAGLITLFALSWFAWPADAARRWDNAALLPSEALLGWKHAASTAASPGVTLLEMVQKEGDAVVPPVKRQRPQQPAATDAPAASPPAAEPAAEKPKPQEAAQPAAREPAAPSQTTASWPDIGGIFAPITEWLAKSNRDYQGTIVKELSKPSPQDVEAQTRRLAEEKAAHERDEAARKAEAANLAAAEEARKNAQAEKARKAVAEAAAKEAEAKKQAEAAKQPEKPTEKQPEKQAEKQQPSESAKQAEAAKAAQAEADARRLKDAARAAEEKRQEQARQEQARKEQAKQQADAERNAREAKLAEDRKAKAEAQAQAAAERAKQAATQPKAAPGAQPASKEQRHRRWAVTIIPEPIERPAAQTSNRQAQANIPRVREANAVLLGARQITPRMSLGAGTLRGPTVKRWVWRSGTCRFAGRKVHVNTRYTVARGDSLWRISEKQYDEGGKYPRIYKANRDRISDPDRIYPCQRFKVPRS